MKEQYGHIIKDIFITYTFYPIHLKKVYSIFGYMSSHPEDTAKL